MLAKRVLSRYTPPKQYFNLHYAGNHKLKYFSMGTQFDPEIDSKDPRQYYIRFSGGNAEDWFVAVDVDTENHLWALNHLNETDTKSMWQACNHKIKSAGFPKLSLFPMLESDKQWFIPRNIHERKAYAHPETQFADRKLVRLHPRLGARAIPSCS